MKLFDLDTYFKYKNIIALLAIIISLVAWAVELMGAVYICPYCRVQRSVIGILGLLLISPFVHHWITKYLALVIGFFGAVVAANQHFMGWKKISAGKFSFNDNIFIDPFLLSAFALTGIVGLVFIILHSGKKD